MIVFIFAVLFTIENGDEVTLRFGLPIKNYQWFVEKVPLCLAILCSILLGALIGGISDFYKRFQLKKTLRQNKRIIERLEREVHSLRNPGLDQDSSFERE